MHYTEKTDIYFKKNLYAFSMNDTTLQSLIKEKAFDRLFTGNNPLYQLVNRELCVSDTCYFKDNSIKDTVDKFSRDYNNHDLENIVANSHEKYFEKLEQRVKQNYPLSLAEFNILAMSHNEFRMKNGNKYDTLYEFFLNFKNETNAVNFKGNLYQDKFEFLVPIEFEVNKTFRKKKKQKQ